MRNKYICDVNYGSGCVRLPFAVMDEHLPRRPLLPVITLNIWRFVVTCACAFVVHTRTCQRTKGVMDIAMCFLFYSGVKACKHAHGCLCALRSSPFLRRPDWSCRWTCRDLLGAAHDLFSDGCVIVRPAVRRTNSCVQNPLFVLLSLNLFFLFLFYLPHTI